MYLNIGHCDNHRIGHVDQIWETSDVLFQTRDENRKATVPTNREIDLLYIRICPVTIDDTHPSWGVAVYGQRGDDKIMIPQLIHKKKNENGEIDESQIVFFFIFIVLFYSLLFFFFKFVLVLLVPEREKMEQFRKRWAECLRQQGKSTGFMELSDELSNTLLDGHCIYVCFLRLLFSFFPVIRSNLLSVCGRPSECVSSRTCCRNTNLPNGSGSTSTC